MYGKMKLFIRTRKGSGMEKLLTDALVAVSPQISPRKGKHIVLTSTHRLCTSDYTMETNDPISFDEFLKRITIHN